MGGGLFTQSHVDHVIGLWDERSLMRQNYVFSVDTALASNQLLSLISMYMTKYH